MKSAIVMINIFLSLNIIDLLTERIGGTINKIL